MSDTREILLVGSSRHLARLEDGPVRRALVNVRSAEGGADALTLHRGARADLIVVDLDLHDGVDVRPSKPGARPLTTGQPVRITLDAYEAALRLGIETNSPDLLWLGVSHPGRPPHVRRSKGTSFPTLPDCSLGYLSHHPEGHGAGTGRNGRYRFTTSHWGNFNGCGWMKRRSGLGFSFFSSSPNGHFILSPTREFIPG